MTTAYKGNLVLSCEVLKNAYVVIEDGIIVDITTEKPKADKYVEINGYIAPGFVDIHCHASREDYFFNMENGAEVASKDHYDNGTTSLILTINRGETHERYLEIIEDVKKQFPKTKNLRGIHFEGPYLNPALGASPNVDYPVKENYMQYIKSGIFTQWTVSPELEGSMELIKELSKAGIITSIGHSNASYETVEQAVKYGARIVTHVFDATAPSPDQPNLVGTQNVDFSTACMMFDDRLYFEVIIDRNWLHVRKRMFEFLLKVVGVDKVVCISDRCAFKDDIDKTSDVNMVNGELSGSKLYLRNVAVNLSNAGYSKPDIAKMTARNGARAIKLEKRGEIAIGYHADLIVVDDNYNFIKHLG